MITYKNITDVEVLESVPENAMALVNDGGELKQVACKEMGGSADGGGVATAIIKSPYSGGVEAISCENMTFEEAAQILREFKPLEAVCVTESGYGRFFTNTIHEVGYDPNDENPVITLCYMSEGEEVYFYWSAKGFSIKYPENNQQNPT